MPRFPLHARKARDRVGSLGEETLILRIREWVGRASPPAPAGIGDDAAVLPRFQGKGLLAIDPVVYGVHFGEAVPPEGVGAKLLKRNLSDVAAMGGRGLAAVVALALDERVSVEWLRRFYRGLARECRKYGVSLVGGDVTRLQEGFVGTLALAGVAPGRVLTRLGARLGDRIYATGRLGRSLSTGKHYLFKPRIAEGAWLARRREVRAVMDLSDGLAKDLLALTPRGSVPAILASAVPKSPGASLKEALGDGEDYELLFVLDQKSSTPAFEAAWRRAFARTPLACLGTFVRPPLPKGALPLGEFHGYEHLR